MASESQAAAGSLVVGLKAVAGGGWPHAAVSAGDEVQGNKEGSFSGEKPALCKGPEADGSRLAGSSGEG